MLPIKYPVYSFSIKIDFKDNKVSTEEKTYEVVGTNEEYFVINDHYFTTLCYKPSEYNTRENFRKVHVHHFNCLQYWDYVEGQIYTHNSSKKIAQKAIKKALEKFLYDKYGRYCLGIDLLDTLKL